MYLTIALQTVPTAESCMLMVLLSHLNPGVTPAAAIMVALNVQQNCAVSIHVLYSSRTIRVDLRHRYE